MINSFISETDCLHIKPSSVEVYEPEGMFPQILSVETFPVGKISGSKYFEVVFQGTKESYITVLPSVTSNDSE